MSNVVTPTDASIILTYRCPMRCVMCNIWKNPTDKKQEIKASDLRTLPRLKFINLTGGEPFIREDLEENPVIEKDLAEIRQETREIDHALRQELQEQQQELKESAAPHHR